MVNQSQRYDIEAIITYYSDLLSHWSDSPDSISNYTSLVSATIKEELAAELECLKKLFAENKSHEDIKLAFRELCKKRQTRNQDSYLSYSAIPEGDCNVMYWKLAQIIFEPKTLQDMVVILLPNVNRVLTINADELLPEKNEFGESLKLADRVNIKLEETDLSNEMFWADIPFDKPSALTTFVVIGNLIFSLEEIRLLPFSLHQQFYGLLDQQQYSNIKKRIYHHNLELEQLQTHIEMCNQNGAASLSDALKKLVINLKLAGSTNTGESYASDSASQACAQFREYLDAFPAEERNKIEAIESNGLTVLAILTRLENEGSSCVQAAARGLTDIMEDKRHAKLLQSRPLFTADQIKEIELHYGKAKPLAIVGFERQTRLPVDFKAQLLSDVTIRTAEEFMDFMLGLPEEEYSAFFSFANVETRTTIPENLNIALGALNPSQINHFFMAIARHPEKFWGWHKILYLAVVAGVSSELLESLLELIPVNERLKMIMAEYDSGHTLLHVAVDNSDMLLLPSLLKVLPEHDRLAFVRKERVLHKAAKNANPLLLSTLLELLPRKDRLTAALDQDSQGRTTLHWASKNPNIAPLQSLLELYPKQKRLAAIKNKDVKGRTALHLAAANSNVALLKMLIDLNPEEDRLAAVKELDSDGRSTLYLAAGSPNKAVLDALLGLYPKQDILAALEETNTSGESMLYLAASNPNPEILKTLLDLYPEQDRLTIVSKSTKYGATILQEAAKNPNPVILQAILELFPTQERFEVVKKRIEDRGSLLFYAASNSNPSLIQFLLTFYSKQDQLTSLMEMNSDGDYDCYDWTVMHIAAMNRKNPKLLSILLSLYPEQERLEALRLTAGLNDSVIKMAIVNLKLLHLLPLINLLPAQDRITAIQENPLLLEETNSDMELIISLLNIIPDQNRLQVLLMSSRDGYGQMIYRATSSANAIQMQTLLSMLPEKDQLTVAELLLPSFARQHYGDPIQKVQVLLALYPAQDQLDVIKKSDKYGYSLLHFAANGANRHLGRDERGVLKFLLRLYPEQDRLSAMKEKTQKGRSVLQEVIEDEWIGQQELEECLSLFPDCIRDSCKQLIALYSKDRQEVAAMRFTPRLLNAKPSSPNEKRNNAILSLLDHLNDQGKIVLSDAEFKSHEEALASDTALGALYESLKQEAPSSRFTG